jgi:glutamyl-tRNA(Gln) amidotransferase subunit D
MKKQLKTPKAGDKIQVRINNKIEKGTLLDSHEKGVLLLKLDQGYNIGLKKEDISEINILQEKQEEKQEEKLKISGKKPIIDFILTGGTISSKLDPETGGVKWLINAQELLNMYPDIFKIADIRIHHPFMKSSENMDNKDWIRLAKLIKKSLNDKQVKGIIVSHGTDFLHYTSAALSFMLGKLNKPVVLTYSQRSSDRGSSDSRLNLICSAHMALSDIAEVILVGHATSNDDYCYALSGVNVCKMHASRRDAFRPINDTPLAKVRSDGKIEILKNNYNKRNKEKININAFFDNRVALIKFYPGQDPKILDYYRKKGYRGLIIEMSGLGHVISEGKNNWIPKLKEIIQKGMFVYAVPQTLYGRLDPLVYSPGRKLKEIGVIYLNQMLSTTALVKLGWILGNKSWRGSVITKQKMLENLHGELKDKEVFDSFLY